MEECISENNGSKKRARDDSGELDSNSPESKRVNASTNSDPNPPESERVDTDIKPDSPDSNKNQHDLVDNSTESNCVENELDSPEVMKFREDILDILDEPEMVPEIQDLDSVIRSFEEEILQTSPAQPHPPVNSVSGESQPDLGYLLEASDDELGLPPAVSEAQAQNQPVNTSDGNEEAANGLANVVGIEDELPSYDSFELGLHERVTNWNDNPTNGNGDFVTVDGFDYDMSDFSDFAGGPFLLCERLGIFGPGWAKLETLDAALVAVDKEVL
ncbi:hypothetical protein ACH5RR_008658 [Cinchona calisaya]|uniref:Uncharacterized protein n=1 Tax=Cinchona calisaya TaxID=153742 RepID=A0ABD3ABZ7_9GENT